MAFPAANVSVPVHHYVNSMIEEFPRQNKVFKIEGTIANRYTRDFLPVNSRGVSGAIEDSYIEFVLNSSELEFFDLESLVLEARLDIEKEDKTALKATDTFTIVDGCGDMLLEKSTVHLNSVPVENNSYYGIYNLIKTYTEMSKNDLLTIGACIGYKSLDLKPVDTLTTATDALDTNHEQAIRQRCRTGFHLSIPIKVDICSSKQFLLNGVEIRIRFDLASPKKIINSSDAAAAYRYTLNGVRLYAQKLVPYTSAINSLNKSLSVQSSFIPYLFERIVGKTYIFPTGHSMIGLDNIFNQHLPSKAYLFMIKQSAYNGAFAQNSAFLSSLNITSLVCEVNGNNVVSLKTEFPNFATNAYYQTIKNLTSDQNLLTLQNWSRGRTVHVFNLDPVISSDTISLERNGNFRLNITCSQALTQNYIIFVLGVFHGNVEVDILRRVKADFLI